MFDQPGLNKLMAWRLEIVKPNAGARAQTWPLAVRITTKAPRAALPASSRLVIKGD